METGLIHSVERHVEADDLHQSEGVARGDRPRAKFVVEGHLAVFHAFAKVNHRHPLHQIIRQAAELHVVSRYRTDRAALEQLAQHPARADLPLAGVRSVEDFVEQK